MRKTRSVGTEFWATSRRQPPSRSRCRSLPVEVMHECTTRHQSADRHPRLKNGSTRAGTTRHPGSSAYGMSVRPLRIWPGVAIVAVVWLSRFGAPLVGGGPSTEFLVRVLGGLAGGAAVAAWWLAFSGAPWSERLGVVGLLIAALATPWLGGDQSIVGWILWYGGPVL